MHLPGFKDNGCFGSCRGDSVGAPEGGTEGRAELVSLDLLERSGMFTHVLVWG